MAGSVLFAILYGGPSFEGYGWLTATFKGDAAILIAPILVVAGVLIGFGAKAAGGCTSGNGLSGNAMASPASITATATFFGTAIVVSFVIKAVI
ncbi:MAG: YeeE/YedE family protein [Actinomycetota bacterium]|nr:YeeE/YedE family protein [Actinomycetota bacterium]